MASSCRRLLAMITKSICGVSQNRGQVMNTTFHLLADSHAFDRKSFLRSRLHHVGRPFFMLRVALARSNCAVSNGPSANVREISTLRGCHIAHHQIPVAPLRRMNVSRFTAGYLFSRARESPPVTTAFFKGCD